MKPARDADGRRLWAVVAATVRPLPGRSIAAPDIVSPTKRAPAPTMPIAPRVLARPANRPPQAIEPGRRRGLERGSETLGGRLDLHGRNQEEARAMLTGFILARHAQGRRSVLVITGKGALGEGVLRRSVPGWLAQTPIREVVAGISRAHRRHGGEGALYVALKRRLS